VQLTLKLIVSPGCTDRRSEYPVIGSMSSVGLLLEEPVTIANRGSCIQSSKEWNQGPFRAEGYAFGGLLRKVHDLVGKVHGRQTTLRVVTHAIEGRALLQRIGAQQKITHIERGVEIGRSPQ
jgi:hypothetical protein